MDFVFGILGVVGGLCCAVGDILFDLKGKGNTQSGPMGVVDSKWLTMAEWRFPATWACCWRQIFAYGASTSCQWMAVV
ncbi:hypothetical protein LJB76_02080 [Clostridia bacterium OttesenSCG-928-O13]|nr:hypothetical protein [Clostridia bacterium OttesenSCG-928-O13]